MLLCRPLIKPVVKPKAASTQQPDEPAAKRLRLEAGGAGESAAAQSGTAADKAKPAGELASLLGGYGSGSDDEDSDEDDGSKQQEGAKKTPLLPSAAELLGADDDKAGIGDASASAQEQPAGEDQDEDGDGSSDDDESDDD